MHHSLEDNRADMALGVPTLYALLQEYMHASGNQHHLNCTISSWPSQAALHSLSSCCMCTKGESLAPPESLLALL